jgi:hypothetical protein
MTKQEQLKERIAKWRWYRHSNAPWEVLTDTTKDYYRKEADCLIDEVLVKMKMAFVDEDQTLPYKSAITPILEHHQKIREAGFKKVTLLEKE